MSKRDTMYLTFAILMFVPIMSGWYGCYTTGPNGSAPPPPPSGFTVNITDQTSTGVTLQIHNGGQIFGNWGEDDDGATGSVYAFPWENQPYTVTNGRVPAVWDGSWDTSDWCDPNVYPYEWSTNIGIAGASVTVGSCVLGGSYLMNSEYLQSGSLPSTLTIQGSGFTTTGGEPQLTVFNAEQLVSQTLATSVGSGGTSATFNFPTSNGTALTSGVYTYTVQNQTSPKVFNTIGGNFFSIGTDNTTYTSPLGVDVGTITTVSGGCNGTPITTNVVPSGPVVTESSASEVKYGTFVMSVGSQPTAVKIYQYASVDHGGGGRGNCTNGPTITSPSSAVSTNFASNNISVVNLTKGTTTSTISVGTEPIALAISGNTAYVANYGSNTISVVDLATNSVSNTVTVGSSPAAVVMDPGGKDFWVGGLNYISEISTSTLATVTTYTVSGQVTSVAIDSGQNDYVYTVVASGNVFMAEHASLSGGVAHDDYQYSYPKGSDHPDNTPSNSPPTWIVSNGPIVSSSYGNRYVVEGTPTGFLVLDLQTGITMLQGTTASAITGIATDPAQGIAYLTEQASNALLSVPLPPQD